MREDDLPKIWAVIVCIYVTQRELRFQHTDCKTCSFRVKYTCKKYLTKPYKCPPVQPNWLLLLCPYCAVTHWLLLQINDWRLYKLVSENHSNCLLFIATWPYAQPADSWAADMLLNDHSNLMITWHTWKKNGIIVIWCFGLIFNYRISVTRPRQHHSEPDTPMLHHFVVVTGRKKYIRSGSVGK